MYKRKKNGENLASKYLRISRKREIYADNSKKKEKVT